jgi:hypothetical protein
MSFLSLTLAMNVLGIATEDKNIAIYNETNEVLTGDMIFSTAIIDCNIAEDSNLMEHPVESGFKIVDSKVFNPVEITIRLALPSYAYQSIYKELRELYEKSTKLRIKTRGHYYKNMVLQGIPHNETAENFDRLVFDLQFKEVKIVEPKYIKLPASQLKNAENSDTQKLGQNVTNSTKKTSILKKGWNVQTDFVKGLLF